MTKNENTEIKLTAIGVVANEIDEMIAPAKIRAVPSRIILDPEFQTGLDSLMPGSQLMVLFHFHQAEGYDLLQHPRKDPQRPKRGIFALRSPRRPNPIGVTIVSIEKIEGNVLTVSGLDAINGTPVLDLKPA